MLSWFATHSDALQTIALFIAALSGGGWALFQFIYARRQETIRQQSVVEMSLEVEPLRLPGQDGQFLNVTVTLANTGDRNTFVSYDSDDHLTVTPCRFDEDGKLTRDAPIKRRLMRSNASPVATNSLLAGGRVELPFMVPIPGPGLYHVRYYARPNARQLAVLHRAGALGVGVNDVVISANRLIVVPQDP